MKLAEISLATFLSDLKGPGLWLRTGPFTTHVQSPLAGLGRVLQSLYGDFPLVENRDFADFHVKLLPGKLRRFYKPQVFFYLDDQLPFKPLALGHASAMFEWCLNWCIESQTNHYLMMHAAIVAKNGYAAILAAPPGSGKSTLAAALVTRGWRLLSDELTLIDPADGRAFPLARPVSLKNESIRVIQEFAPDAVIGPVAHDTLKGSVAHMKPPRESVERVSEPALPRWVIFPKFEVGARASLDPYPRSHTLLRLADQAFNYSQYGVKSFQRFVQLIDGCDGYEFIYSDLREAIDIFESLASHRTSRIS